MKNSKARQKITGCLDRSECPITNTLDLIGDKWTLLIIRDMLFLKKKSFNEFLESPEGIATNILTDRLKGLLSMGIIEYLPHPKHKSKKIYYLTQKGKDLLPIMVDMIIWGGNYHPAPDMPKDRFERIKKDPRKFIQNVWKDLELWEVKNLKKVSTSSKKRGGL